MKAILSLALILVFTTNSNAHKLPPAVQKIVSEATKLETNIKTGKKLYVNRCSACHGQKGIPLNSSTSEIPFLNDQTPTYSLIHMAMFKTMNRTNVVMNAVASSLTTQDMADIKAYLISDEIKAAHCENEMSDVNPETFGGNIEAGRILAQKKREFVRSDGSVVGISCTMCHGDNGLMPDASRSATKHPDLASLGTKYLMKQFLAFQKNERVNAGPMNLMVKDLTLQDLKDLSAYYASLSHCR